MKQDKTPEGEVWWIYTKRKEPWAGLRIAHFGWTSDEPPIEIFFILGDYEDRMGIRIWNEVSQREGWRKVAQIAVPMIAEEP